MEESSLKVDSKTVELRNAWNGSGISLYPSVGQ